MLESEIAKVEAMSIDELKECYRSYFGWNCKSIHREFLTARIIYRLQELRYGGLSNTTRYLLNSLSIPDPKIELSPGMVLERQYKNKVYQLEIYQGYYMMNGKRYDSLSAAAKAITGQRLSGTQFFKLRKEI